jgi:hypothetical protein
MIPRLSGDFEGRERIRRDNSVKYYGVIPSMSRWERVVMILIIFDLEDLRNNLSGLFGVALRRFAVCSRCQDLISVFEKWLRFFIS